MTQALQKAADFTAEQIQIIKDTVAKDASDSELQFFLAVAKRVGLDPFARQIFYVKRYDAQLRREVGVPQTSIDGFRLIADRTGHYAPGRPTEFQFDDKGNLYSATAYVLKFVPAAREWKEASATVFYAEAVQKTRDGVPNRMWQTMPKRMLEKTSEAAALRKAFPAELSGLYGQEEIQESDPVPPTETVVNATVVVDTPKQIAAVPAEVIVSRKESFADVKKILDCMRATGCGIDGPEKSAAAKMDDIQAHDLAKKYRACLEEHVTELMQHGIDTGVLKGEVGKLATLKLDDLIAQANLTHALIDAEPEPEPEMPTGDSLFP